MPDYFLMAKGVLTAAAVAGALLLAFTGNGRASMSWRSALGWVVSVGLGLFVGYAGLDQWPRWPPLEDRDRLLLVLVPLTLAAEFAAATLPGTWLRRIPRLFVAASAAPILLNGTVYLEKPLHALLLFVVLAAVLTLVWALLQRLDDVSPEQTVAPLLLPVLFAAALTVMLCGYFRGGTLALPIAGALLGALLASQLAARQSGDGPALGLGVIGLASTLTLGRFFGSLPTSLALALLFTPLLAWITTLPRLRELPSAAKTAVQFAAILAVLVAVLVYAWMRFQTAIRH